MAEVENDEDALSIGEVHRMIKAKIAITTMREALGAKYDQEAPTLANYLAGIARRPELLERVTTAMRNVSTIHMRRTGDRLTACTCGATEDHEAPVSTGA